MESRRVDMSGCWASVMVAACALLLFGARTFAADEAERWLLLRFGGAAVGYVHEATAAMGDSVRTTTDSRMVINRLGNRVVVESSVVADEDARGALRDVRVTVAMGSAPTTPPTTTVATIAGGRLKVRTGSADHPFESERALTDELLGPDAIRRGTRERLRAVGDEFTCTTFVAELGAPARVTRTRLADDGGARVVREAVAGSSTRTLWLDGDGATVRSREASPLGEMTLERATRDAALAAAGGNELPAELFTQSLARANVRLPRPREIDAVTLELTQREPALGWPKLEGDGQDVEARGDGSLRVTVTRSDLEEGGGGDDRAENAERAATPDLRACLEPGPIIDCDDAKVVALARAVNVDGADPLALALALRDRVHDLMSMDLGVALVPASEVARTHRGTCAAYSSLLTALCRARGIPARCVMGLAYVNGIWGGHAWTEARVDGRWIALDAALPSDGVADAARLRCGASSLRDGPGELMSALQPVLGHVDVRVVSYRLDGCTVEVPADAPLSRVDGDRYTNLGLGLSFAKPHEFKFASVDATWPETAVVSLRGPRGESVRLEEVALSNALPRGRALREVLPDRGVDAVDAKVAGARAAQRCTSGRTAAIAIADGLQAWVVVAEADEPAALLDAILATLDLGARASR